MPIWAGVSQGGGTNIITFECTSSHGDFEENIGAVH